MRKRKLKEQEVSRRDFLKKGATAGVGATALAGLGARAVEAQDFWDLSADVVTIGAGTAGLAAAISALDHGASVILLEENVDVGGHGMCSGGQVHLGGGTSNQLKRGVEDSADQVFLDWVRHDHGQSRYSDRDLVRAFADENAATFEFLIENGVEFQDHLTGPTGASTVPRLQRTVQWPIASERVTHHPTRVGSGLVRALEASARSKGAQVLLRHKMTSIVRESSSAGRVLGVTAVHEGRALNIAARKGLLVATGGSSSNVNLRRTFDPRLTEEYQVAPPVVEMRTAAASPPHGPGPDTHGVQVDQGLIAVIPLITDDLFQRLPIVTLACASSNGGLEAAMETFASIAARNAWPWGPPWRLGYGQSNGRSRPRARIAISKTRHIGCRWGYTSLIWQPDARIFDLARASGLTVGDWQDVILVNQTGRRFWNELDARYDFFAAAMAYNERPHYHALLFA